MGQVIYGILTDFPDTKPENIEIDLDDGLFLPKISTLNELRRNALESTYNFAISNIKRCRKN